MTLQKKKSRLLRVFAPFLIVIIWLGLSGVGGPYFGKIDEVASSDLATFLPESAESTRVNSLLKDFRDSNTIPAIIVFESENTLTKADKKELKEVQTELDDTQYVTETISPPIIADDNRAAFMIVPLDAESEFDKVIPNLQTTVADTDTKLTYKFTGPAMFAQDLNKAFAGIDGILLLTALSVVFVILLVVYRSPVLPVITLLGAIFALSAAILVVWHLANAGLIELNGQVQGILFILVIGAATDYALLYIARYREELSRTSDKLAATKATLKASWEPIVAAGGTVTLGLLCLLASDLASNKALGPVGGIGIIFAVLSALTFLPAVLLLFGRTAFWPRQPRVAKTRSTSYTATHPIWSKVGAFVGRHPRRIWVGFTVLLLVACLFMPQLRANGVAQSDFVLGKSEARKGQILLDKHFPAGSGTPVYLIVPRHEQRSVVKQLDRDKGIDAVSITTTNDEKPAAPAGTAAKELRQTIRKEIKQDRIEKLGELRSDLEKKLQGTPEFVIDQTYDKVVANIPTVKELLKKAYPFSDTKPKILNDTVLLQATLTDPADSLEARETIQRLRNTIETKHPKVLVGGVSAVQLDTNTAAEHDLRTIIPLILLAITIVLMLLLRAIIAPLVLLLTTVISFGATLGIAALLFNNVWNYPGADPSVIIFGFVFLVALGIDYNIFLMTRVREETMKLGVRRGTLKALVVTGGVISSAGIVLASTFAALYVIPILFLAQIAFIVAFGVLLDTLIVRSLIVPGLTLEIGRFMWWPSKLGRKK